MAKKVYKVFLDEFESYEEYIEKNIFEILTDLFKNNINEFAFIELNQIGKIQTKSEDEINEYEEVTKYELDFSDIVMILGIEDCCDYSELLERYIEHLLNS